MRFDAASSRSTADARSEYVLVRIAGPLRIRYSFIRSLLSRPHSFGIAYATTGCAFGGKCAARNVFPPTMASSRRALPVHDSGVCATPVPRTVQGRICPQGSAYARTQAAA